MKSTKPVKSFKHKEAKRAHIPSAEEAGYEAESAKVKEASAVELPLNPVITRGQDPELFWMHKYGSDEKLTAQLNTLHEKLKAGDTAGARTALELLRDVIMHRYQRPEDESLHVDIRSLYRHEHLAPETLIKGLYRIVVENAANQDELFAVNELFGNAIGHEELDKVTDYYTHSDGWTNRLIQGDSLLVMTSLLEREGMTGQVQCLYFDPPYGIKYGGNWQLKLNDRRMGETDSDDQLSGEPEQIKAFRDTWELGIHSYLSYLRERLLVARQLLHESGSCFVQISDENVHLVRNLMDEVFGSGCFFAEFLVKKKGSQKAEFIEAVNDYVLWYGKVPKEEKKTKFRPIFEKVSVDSETLSEYKYVELEDGTAFEVANAKTPEGEHFDYRLSPRRLFIDYPMVEKKAYLHIGPKFGTVSKQAVTEAIKACRDKRDGDWLLILGFAFESGITELSRSFGNFQVSIVRMHDDLLQQGLLKKDKKAASFVTIGEPDIKPHRENGTATVEVAGLDIYDPIKDEVKSRDVHDIAYWMVDDDYDGSSFVVRQVFFCGGDKDEFDEWKKGLSDLAKAKTKKAAELTLKIEIDDEAFSRIYGNKSHPFPVKKGQKVAVRVVSQFGEETTKVLEVK